jgi:hypothetical protein
MVVWSQRDQMRLPAPRRTVTPVRVPLSERAAVGSSIASRGAAPARRSGGGAGRANGYVAAVGGSGLGLVL